MGVCSGFRSDSVDSFAFFSPVCIVYCSKNLECHDANPVNIEHLYNINIMLDQRRGRWACAVFTGKHLAHLTKMIK